MPEPGGDILTIGEIDLVTGSLGEVALQLCLGPPILCTDVVAHEVSTGAC
jgi:hypothetical protein